MSFFEKPKEPQGFVAQGQKRFFIGQDGYKKICTIDSVLPNKRVAVTINGDHYDAPLRNIGQLCD